jgi:hypothetical protein
MASGGGFMTNREAMETVLDAAELYITLMKEKSMAYKGEELDDAIFQMQAYQNDVMED